MLCAFRDLYPGIRNLTLIIIRIKKTIFVTLFYLSLFSIIDLQKYFQLSIQTRTCKLIRMHRLARQNVKAYMKSYIPLETAAIFFSSEPFPKTGY